MVALNQTMINTFLADSRYTSAFPDLAEARRRMTVLTQKDVGGCCGAAANNLANNANDIRNVLSWLKRTIANWSQSDISRFLTMLGQPVLQISYNNTATGALTTVVVRR